MKIIIIGTGWFGLYSALLLQEKHDVIIIEKNKDIFNNSSYYNQNRLHLGFHYVRNSKTRKMCKKNFNRFKKLNLSEKIENNIYLISKHSLVDYDTFKSIYSYENYDFKEVENKNFKNIDGNCLIVGEEYINSEKTKNFFKNKIKCKILFEKKVTNVNINETPYVILENGDKYYADLILDCSYNSLGLSELNYKYEMTITLLYKKKPDFNFGALTIMDGDFLSIYPRDIEKNLYTLTDVEFTPLFTSNKISDVNNYILEDEILDEVKKNMENKTEYYYQDFKSNFEYHGYFLANKTKLLSNSDSRECIIENKNNKLITINCGKIIGIFEMEDYFRNLKII